MTRQKLLAQRNPNAPRVKQAAQLRNEGLHVTEIAERMHISVGTANGYLSTALQAGLCGRHRAKGEDATYRKAAAIYKRVSGTLGVSASLTAVANEMGVTRKHASSLLSKARQVGVLAPSKIKLGGEASDLNRLLDNETAAWVRSQRVDGMTDMEMVAILLNDMRLDAEGQAE